MKRIFLSLFLSVVILLCGCAAELPEPSTKIELAQPETIAAACTLPETEPVATTVPQIETVPPDISISAGVHLRRFSSEQTGDYLDYYLFVPESAVSGMPLLVFLHGDGEVGNLERLKGYGPNQAIREIYGENYPFILIVPCTRQPSWTNGTIPETLKGLIEASAAECSAAQDRIILTGHSRGAMGVWYMVSTYGDYFSAAVPVSCGTGCVLNYENLAKVKIFALAGDNDEYENIYRAQMEIIVGEIQKNGGNAIFTRLEGCGHGETAREAYTKELFEQILEN